MVDIKFHFNLNVSSLFDSATASLILRDVLMQRDFGLLESDQVNGLIQDVSLQEKEQLAWDIFRMWMLQDHEIGFPKLNCQDASKHVSQQHNTNKQRSIFHQQDPLLS